MNFYLNPDGLAVLTNDFWTDYYLVFAPVSSSVPPIMDKAISDRY